jgi:hypothetical protein
MRTLTNRLLPVLGLAFCLGPAATAAITYNFGTSPSQTLGVEQDYTVSGVTIKAYGYDNSGTGTALYNKFTSGNSGETGLGIASDVQHEIGTLNFVRLDLSAFFPPGVTSQQVTFTIGSLSGSPGESYAAYFADANTGGKHTGNTIAGGTGTGSSSIDQITQTVTLTHNYIEFTATSVNVLLESITVTPEPGFYGALAVGLSGLMFVGMRRRKQS